MELTSIDNIILQAFLFAEWLACLANESYFDNVDNLPHAFPELYRSLFSKLHGGSQCMMLLTLYFFLVLPREKSKELYDIEEFNSKLAVVPVIRSNSTTTYKSDDSHLNYIRHIRNAIAHGNVTFLYEPTFQQPPSSQHLSDKFTGGTLIQVNCIQFEDSNDKGTEQCSIKIPTYKLAECLIDPLREKFRSYIITKLSCP